MILIVFNSSALSNNDAVCFNQECTNQQHCCERMHWLVYNARDKTNVDALSNHWSQSCKTAWQMGTPFGGVGCVTWRGYIVYSILYWLACCLFYIYFNNYVDTNVFLYSRVYRTIGGEQCVSADSFWPYNLHYIHSYLTNIYLVIRISYWYSCKHCSLV